MDKRLLAGIFKERLGELVARQPGGLARFARDTGLDRSALSQFLSEEVDRLPRAESLRRIAEAKHVTVDWLLGLSNVAEGGQEITSSVKIEAAIYDDGGTPLGRWRRETAGHKLRYVPTTLPDMLRLPEVGVFEATEPFDDRWPPDSHAPTQSLDDDVVGELDVEIAMPIHRIHALAEGGGYWRGLDAGTRRRQLVHMATLTEQRYPALRLHLYDQRQIFAAPLTVFGRERAAIYLGGTYLVVTAADQVKSITQLFDSLLRAAVVGPDRVHKTFRALAEQV